MKMLYGKKNGCGPFHFSAVEADKCFSSLCSDLRSSDSIFSANRDSRLSYGPWRAQAGLQTAKRILLHPNVGILSQSPECHPSRGVATGFLGPHLSGQTA